mmetsp:Transcript_11455/g.32181  ORF Transcript_11455/g.32181 Transcript_11455/m.32181 type:complete len:251 (-) Transcript_11455:15-767(-)
MSKSFKYIYIPVGSKEIEERTMTYTDTTEVECMTSALQEHFKQSGGQASSEEAMKTYKEQLRANLKEKGQEECLQNLDAGLLNMLMNMQTVDIVALLPNTRDTDFVGVNMYVDDRGVSKQLSVNERATAIAANCGMNVAIRGDAFIARVRETNTDEYARLDFCLEELSPASPWYKIAQTVHAKRASENLMPSASHAATVTKGPDDCQSLSCSAPGTMRCGRCKVVKYCGRDCQRAHWGSHKATCTAKETK